MMVGMSDMRRNSREPLPGPPQVRMKPGMADELMQELAPLLAEDGVDINDLTDMDALNRALQKAVERRNMELFTPVGARRDQAIALLMLVVAAIADDDTKRAGSLLEKAQPESPDNSAPEVSSCIGLALGLLDSWLTGQDSQSPVTLARDTRRALVREARCGQRARSRPQRSRVPVVGVPDCHAGKPSVPRRNLPDGGRCCAGLVSH